MSDGFKVDLPTVTGIGESISRTVDDLGERAVMPVAGDAVGHVGLDAALSGFHARWQQGVRHLTQDGQRFGDGLAQAGAAYQEVEQRIAEALRTTDC